MLQKYMKLKTIEYLRENKKKFCLCRICQEIVKKEHFDSKEQYNNTIKCIF